MQKRRHILIWAMTAWGVVMGASQGASGAPQWYRLKSRNFELLTSAGEKKGRSLILYFEQVRSFFIANLKMPPEDKDAAPVHIVGFESEKEFSPFQTSSFSKAFYNGGTRGDYIVMQTISPDSYPLAVHEYVHLLIRRSGFRAPPWWHEGLADLYSTLRTSGEKVDVGEIPASRNDYLLRQRNWIDLAALMAADQYSPLYNDAKTAELFYAESWALVHMLSLSEGYKTRFGEFADLLKKGSSGEASLKSVYGKTPGQAQEDLAAYVKQGAGGRVQYPVAQDAAAGPVEAAPAADLQVQLSFANVLTGIGKLKQAAEILNQLSSRYPDSWEVEESLAYLSWYAADRESARRHFGRAAEKGMRSAGGYLDYAALLGETGVPAATLTALVEKALALQPESRDAKLKLASLYLTERKYEEADALIKNAGPLKAEQSLQAYCVQSYAQLGLRNLPEAKRAAEVARPFAHTVTEKSTMADLDRAIRQQETEAAALKTQDTKPAPANSPAIPQVPDKAGPNHPSAPQTPEPRQVRGKLRRIDCLGDKLRLILDVNGNTMAVAVMDPYAITIKGKPTGTVAFYCGNQPDTAVTVTFTPVSDAKLGTAGIVTVIEFTN